MNARALAALLASAALLAGAVARAAEAPVVRDAISAASQPAEAPASAALAEPSACPPEPVVPTGDEAAAAMRAATDGGFLWKATRNGRTTWLYGTIHVAQREWMFPGPLVMKAILASDVVALELDPTDPEIMRRLQRVILRRPGSPELAPDLEARLQAQMAAACLAPASLASLRPEMRAVTLEVMSGRAMGLQPAYGIDAFIGGLAHGLKKPVRSLETPESQAALLVSDDPAETAHSVEQILDELEGGKGARILDRVAGDWHRGDLADMSTYADWCECMATPQQRADFARIVDDRNPPMADRVAQWHAEGKSLFVAVGSLHMVGPNGLPALLRARGFVVERVAFAGVPKA